MQIVSIALMGFMQNVNKKKYQYFWLEKHPLSGSVPIYLVYKDYFQVRFREICSLFLSKKSH